MRIFVSIASYRDPQLLPTIADCLAKARYPQDLRFTICWQHATDEPAPPVDDPRFRVIDVDFRASRGACWARAEIMQLWSGEEFYLQIDSHHRFVPEWDRRLLELVELTGSAKPVISTYPPPFTPGDPHQLINEPMQINFDRFTEDGIPTFKPTPIIDPDRTWPLRARFLGACFLFTIGDFVSQVPYDPELYFIGEEITLAIRAYTHGFDLFHPPDVVAWHYYTRAAEVKHWDDHRSGTLLGEPWFEMDRRSRTKVASMLVGRHPGPFGDGTARTLQEYEAYVGLDFARRRVQDHTLTGLEPPNPPARRNWAEQTRPRDLRIDIDRAIIGGNDDANFWYVGFHDAAGDEIYREDAPEAELAAALAGYGPAVSLWRAFESIREPVSWTVWPHSRSRGWLEQIRGPCPAGD